MMIFAYQDSRLLGKRNFVCLVEYNPGCKVNGDEILNNPRFILSDL
jgi:hypothetical protein